jgi:acyl-CoA synthetase (AMP-forming)/AMP-acid ligase II
MTTIMNLALYLLDPDRDDVLLNLATGEDVHRSHLRSAVGWLAEAFRGEGLVDSRVAIDLSPAFGAVAAYLALLLNGNTVVAARRVNQAPWKGYLASASTTAIVRAVPPAPGRSARFAPVTISRHGPAAPVELVPPGPPATAGGERAGDVDLAALAAPPERPAVDLFTSGTTGRPKMVELGHGALIHSSESILAALPVRSSTRTALILSLAHSFGLSVLHTHLRAGASLHCVERPEFPGDVLRALTDGGCNSLAAVPAQLRAITATLRKSPPGAGSVDISLVMQAGGRLEVSDSEALLATLGRDCRLYPMYGQTEAAARIAILDAADRARVPGSVGRPLRGLQVRIVDPAGNELPPGTEGEVIAYGPTLMDGYYDDQKATDEVLRAGWLHTGDFGHLDAEGFLYITGRRSNFVKVDGERISLEAVEHAAITAAPGVVQDALARPVRAGDDWAIALEVRLDDDVPATGVDIDALSKVLRHGIRTTLGSKSVPATCAVVDEIRYTPNGKKTRADIRY